MADENKDVEVKREEREDRRSGGFPNPLEPLVHFREEMDRLFEDVTSGWPWGHGRRRGHGMTEPFRGTPFAWHTDVAAVDVVDLDKEIQVRAELPGMNEDDIEVQLGDGILTIKGEKKEETEAGEKGSSYYVSERRYGSFQRSFHVPDGVDLDQVDATFKKGVLTVTLPKTKEARERVKKIKVKGDQ